MDQNVFKRTMDDYCEKIDNALIDFLPKANDGQGIVVRAMKYSLSNGGKRLRPILTMEFCKMCGGLPEDALEYACAIEYIHTYSLIHDDLPCMDDDDLRRGNPSCHKMFGEANALLAGDALLTHAFDIAAGADLTSMQNAKAVSLIAQNSGVGGMIGGQVIDLKFETQDPSVSDLLTIHKLKTGALVSTACILGCIAAKANDEQIASASRFAYFLGTAFQIKDDLLDVYGNEEKLGKPVGSDASNDKTTYVTLLGAEKAQEDVEKLTRSAIAQLNGFRNKDFVIELCNQLITREK